MEEKIYFNKDGVTVSNFRIEIAYDRWDKDHPFWQHPSYMYTRENLDNMVNATLYKKLISCFNDKIDKQERKYIDYILYSLAASQEYDAGNAIVLVIQEGLISYDSILRIAKIFTSKLCQFESRVGRIIFSQLSMIIGLLLIEKGEKQFGTEIIKIGINNTTKMDYGKDNIVKEWLRLKDNYQNLPPEVVDLIDMLDK